MEIVKTFVSNGVALLQKAATRTWLFVGRKPWLYMPTLALPIALFALPILLSGQRIAPGDADYQFHLYEAFRRSVLEFGQFPFWDPWISGGIPLFGNIQLGIISVQAPLILLFGSIIGFKISYVIYLLIGFFGFRVLFTQHFKTPQLRAVLLAYIWTFSTFTVYRVQGHFTFLLFHFIPWILLFYFKRYQKWGWLKLALVLSLMIWSSPHYATIMTIAVLGFVFLFETVKISIIKKWFRLRFSFRIAELKLWGKIFGVILLLCFYRLFFVFQFIRDFPRPDGSPEPFFGIFNGLLAMFGPVQFGPHIPQTPLWGWLEASAYIGIATAVALGLVIFVYVRHRQQRSALFTYSPVILFGLGVLFFALAQGHVTPLSPFSLLQNFPIFEGMRVATRWFIWASIIVLCILAAYKGRRFAYTITMLLAVSCIELFVIAQAPMRDTFVIQPQQYRPAAAPFEQQIDFDAPRKGAAPFDENLYAATRSNYGQIIASDPLVNTSAEDISIRCDVDKKCPFVLSRNARVAYWSPNKIELQRTQPGSIELNMNPGNDWTINDAYVMRDYKIADPTRRFVIDQDGNYFTLRYAPELSPEWFAWQFRQLVRQDGDTYN